MTTKIAISLPDELVERARHAVETGKAASVSAYFAQAATRMAREDELAALLDELDRDYGPPSDADYAEARQTLGIE